MSAHLPVVHVAMATYNGRRWIQDQVDTILGQEDVEVRLVVSDDGSNDGTAKWVGELAAHDKRVTLLPLREGESSVAANFLYAFQSLDVQPGQYAAFSDQDDLWNPRKLVEQIELMKQSGANAVSANVTAFSVTERGELKKTLIRKDQEQVEWDFIFEAPGAGSTYVFDFHAWQTIVEYLHRWGSEGVAVHDWFVYVVARSSNLKWVIDSRSQVAYRQHGQNVAGAHKGLGAVADRFQLLRSGHYRRQFLLMTEVARQAGLDSGAPQEFLDGLEGWKQRLENTSVGGRLSVARHARQMRRRPLDQITLAAACVLGAW